MPQPTRIPKPTVRRLSLYLRALQSRLGADAPEGISSRELGEAAGVYLRAFVRMFRKS